MLVQAINSRMLKHKGLLTSWFLSFIIVLVLVGCKNNSNISSDAAANNGDIVSLTITG